MLPFRTKTPVTVLLVSATLMLAGCASSSLVVGKVRPAITPEQVKFYLHPPKKYEEVAVVESSSQSSLAVSAQGKMDVVVRRLKKEAAKVGANGVLFQTTGNQSVGSVGNATSYGAANGGAAFGASLAVMIKTGSGLAIYVEEE